jgi:hypothetical protein
MEGRFEFEGSEVLALLEESSAAGERLLTEAQRFVAAGVDLRDPDAAWDEEVERPEVGAPPGLWLMNDRGVYLRSNARQRDGASVAYARGYRAEVPVGEEPICEFIDAAPLQQLRPDDTLLVKLSEQRIGLALIRDS